MLNVCVAIAIVAGSNVEGLTLRIFAVLHAADEDEKGDDGVTRIFYHNHLVNLVIASL